MNNSTNLANNKLTLCLFARYLVVLLLSFNGLFVIYYVFSPITFYLSLYFLSLFGNVSGFFLEKLIVFNSINIELVNACIAGAAYYLLIFLNLSISMDYKKRIKSLSFSIFFFLIVNVLRIVIFSLLASSSSNYFDSLHIFTWYFLSIIMVVGTWFLTIKVFDIKGVPIYDDIRRILNLIKKR